MREIFAKKKKRGFTLIELLVVIAIIGMLAGIVLVSLGGARAKARDAKRQSDIRQISLAMEMCLDDSNCGAAGVYCTSATMPTAIGNGGATCAAGTSPYLSPVPTDPIGAAAYGWQSNTGDNTQYCSWAVLEGETDTCFAASEKGTTKLTGDACPPTALSCW